MGRGTVEVSIDGFPVRNHALVVVLSHDGWVAMATEPDADGRSFSPEEAAVCLRRIAGMVEDNPDGDFPAASDVVGPQ
jgi:hypothetical protein